MMYNNLMNHIDAYLRRLRVTSLLFIVCRIVGSADVAVVTYYTFMHYRYLSYQ